MILPISLLAVAAVLAVALPDPSPKVSESAILKSCLHYLNLRGIEAFRMNTGMAMLPGRGGKLQPVRFGKKGLPDICGYLDGGRALFVEVKSATGKLRPEQRAFLERAERCGCKVVVARSVDDLIAAGL